MRNLRYLPKPGAVVEITQRTIQGRLLLRPSRRLNALLVGCLARAQKNTQVKVHAVAALSTHFHILASFETVKQMSKFMCHLKTNMSKEVGRLHHWEGPMFAGRYRSIPLSDEPEVQVDRLKYILSQGAKEGLVLSPKDWPGVHAAKALAEGSPLRGLWIDRTELYAARQKRRDTTEAEFSHEEELHLKPLPCWAELDKDRRKRKVRTMLKDIEQSALAMHQEVGTVALGASTILSRHPHERANRLAKSPLPRFHAATKKVRRLLFEGYREFYAAFRLAAEKLEAGDLGVVFPKNCFPPGMPFLEPALI